MDQPLPWLPDTRWTIPGPTRQILGEEIRKAHPAARAYLFHAQAVADLSEVVQNSDGVLEIALQAWPPEHHPSSGKFGATGADDRADPRLELIKSICVRPSRGIFEVISQISPNGSDGFEDLTMLDGSNPDEWLLVIVVPQEDDWIVYRKLYRGQF
jgi:hypothetical protein